MGNNKKLSTGKIIGIIVLIIICLIGLFFAIGGVYIAFDSHYTGGFLSGTIVGIALMVASGGLFGFILSLFGVIYLFKSSNKNLLSLYIKLIGIITVILSIVSFIYIYFFYYTPIIIPSIIFVIGIICIFNEKIFGSKKKEEKIEL